MLCKWRAMWMGGDSKNKNWRRAKKKKKKPYHYPSANIIANKVFRQIQSVDFRESLVHIEKSLSARCRRPPKWKYLSYPTGRYLSSGLIKSNTIYTMFSLSTLSVHSQKYFECSSNNSQRDIVHNKPPAYKRVQCRAELAEINYSNDSDAISVLLHDICDM